MLLKMFNKELWVDIVKSFISTLMMGIGITLFIACELGSDPMSVFLDGFHRISGMEISIIDQIINCILFLIGFIVNRKVIGVNTIINVLFLGICIQIPSVIIENIHLAEQALWVRIAAMVVAQLLLATSFAWLQTFKKGISSLDAVFFFIIEKTGLSYKVIRIIYDAIFIVTGAILGGIVGIGTVFSLLTNGYFTEKIRLIIDNVINRRQERRVENERRYNTSVNVYNTKRW